MTGDDYYQAHLELYESLMAANPAQLQELATSWGIIGQITTQISDTLNDYLSNLPDFWNSTASEEYTRRLNLITTYANALSKQQKILQTRVDNWSGVVLSAQAQAESPEEVDTAAEAAYDDYMASPSAVIDEWAGVRMSDNARKDAYYRLVTLVDDVSTEYEVSGQMIDPVTPDPDLPGTDAVMTAGTSSSSGSTYSASKLSTSTAAATSATAASVAASAAMTTSPILGPNDPAASSDDADGVTALAGADGSGVIGLAAATSAAASGGAIYSQITLAPTAGTAGGMGTTGLGITATGTTIPAGGVLASSNTTGLKTPNPTLTGDGANRTNTPTNRTNLTTNTTRTGTNPTDHDDDTDEHTTWLTEDDMIWGDEELDNIPPAAIE